MPRSFRAPLAAALLATCAGAATGTGPGGYTWTDCEETGGPACDYVVAAASDGLTGLCSDEIYSPPGGLGFAFPFYGTTYNSFAVSANGVVYLLGTPVDDAANAALTGTEGFGLIAPLWDDWAMDNDDELAFICPDPGCANSGPLTFVESYRLGSGTDAGVRYRDIEWFDTAKHRPTCSEPETATFGVRLYADGRILFNYFDVEVGQPAETDGGVSATIGISRGSAGEYTQVSSDAARIPFVPYSILFEPPCPALRCNSITAPADACEGDTVQLRVNIGGGTAPFTVTWDLDGDTLPDAFGNPVDVSLPAGANDVTAMVSDSCASPGPATCSTSRTVTVHATPAPVISPSGPLSFCIARGESVTLDAGPGWASYEWRYLGMPLTGGQTFQPVDTGYYTVVVTDAWGCSGESPRVDVDTMSCPTCAQLDCGAVILPPSPACEGDTLRFELWIDPPGVPPVVVTWDFDGDGSVDATGNPVDVSLAFGSYLVRATATDACADPGPQSCWSGTPFDVVPGGAAVGETSGAGAEPLLVVTKSGRVEVEARPLATAYHAYADAIGSWWSPSDATGRSCGLAAMATGARPGTIVLDTSIPTNSWIVVTAATACGEGPAGTSSLGVARETGAGWTPCGP